MFKGAIRFHESVAQALVVIYPNAAISPIKLMGKKDPLTVPWHSKDNGSLEMFQVSYAAWTGRIAAIDGEGLDWG